MLQALFTDIFFRITDDHLQSFHKTGIAISSSASDL